MRSDTTISTVAVVHLIWIPYGIGLFQQFISSYKAHASGYEHQLVLLFNGVENEAVAMPFHKCASQHNLEYSSYYKKGGQDLEAYFWIAPQIKTDYVFFLNSYSQLLSENWLLKYMNAVSCQHNFGVVSATASYQSYFTSMLHENSWRWGKDASLSANFKKYKLLVKAILLYPFYFKPFPNPHIRTTAFLINRKLFLSISFKKPSNKLQAYMFESGRNGFTMQLLKRDLAVSVIDKNGNLYAIPDWYKSQTFWNRKQENLLVSDNQTGKFQAAGKHGRKQMTYKAWGIYE